MEKKKNLGVVGSRSFADYGRLVEILESLGATKIVSGGARGADSLAERFASEAAIEVVVIRPDYAKHGRGAPLRRNELIVELADELVAFWDGQSAGTKATIEMAKRRGKPVHVVPFVPS